MALSPVVLPYGPLWKVSPLPAKLRGQALTLTLAVVLPRNIKVKA